MAGSPGSPVVGRSRRLPDERDRDLVRLAKAGDVDAYALLLRAHEAAARRLAYALCGSDADDAVQDAFVRAWRGLDSYREDAPFRVWLLRIVANHARNRRRAAGRRVVYELRGEVSASVPSAEVTMVVHEERRRVATAVAGLPERLRDVVVCRHLLELSEAETAAVLRLPPGTVKSRLSRALDRLRSVLEVERV